MNKTNKTKGLNRTNPIELLSDNRQTKNKKMVQTLKIVKKKGFAYHINKFSHSDGSYSYLVLAERKQPKKQEVSIWEALGVPQI